MSALSGEQPISSRPFGFHEFLDLSADVLPLRRLLSARAQRSGFSGEQERDNCENGGPRMARVSLVL